MGIQPPDSEETGKEALRLVCLPSPRSDDVKIVGQMQDSKNSTKLSIAMPVLPFVPIAVVINTIMPLIYVSRM